MKRYVPSVISPRLMRSVKYFWASAAIMSTQPKNAQTDAKAEPNVIGQWVAKKIARSTPPHRIIRAVKVRLGISFEGVSEGSRGPAHASELNGGGDVKRHTYLQDDPDKP